MYPDESADSGVSPWLRNSWAYVSPEKQRRRTLCRWAISPRGRKEKVRLHEGYRLERLLPRYSMRLSGEVVQVDLKPSLAMKACLPVMLTLSTVKVQSNSSQSNFYRKILK